MLRREYLSSAVNGLTKCRKDFAYHSERPFQLELPTQGSINMVKVLSFRFQHCFGLLTMLLVEGFSETGLFRHLSNHVFRSPVSSKMHQLSLPSFYWTCSKFILNLENAKKSSENIFRSLHNSIWKCCNKLPLSRREYLSSTVNGLKNSIKIFHITHRDFFNLNGLHMGYINMIKVLSFRFQQWFGPFSMLLVEGSSQTGLLKHLSEDVFRIP